MIVRLMHNNKSFDLNVDDPSCEIQSLKKQLVEVVNNGQLKADNQKWIYKGKVLTDVETLLTSGFTDGDTIHVLQTSTTSASVPSSGAAIPRMPFPVPQFDNAMRSLLSLHESSAEIIPALSTVLKIISNIIRNPFEEKYRKIKSSNKLVQQKIVSVPGALGVLLATGFADVGEEYAISISSSAWEVLLACERKLEVFLKKLEVVEDGMMTNAQLRAASSSPPSSSAAPPLPVPSSSSSASGDNQQSEGSTVALQQFILALASSGLPTVTTNAPSTKVFISMDACCHSLSYRTSLFFEWGCPSCD